MHNENTFFITDAAEATVNLNSNMAVENPSPEILFITSYPPRECGIATYSQSGAKFGFGTLWIFPIMYPLLLAVQESCSRIGAVTGKGLAAVIKSNYSKKLLYASVILVVVANTINIGADLGAMAATTQLFIDVPFALLAIIYAVIIVLLVVFINYKKYVKIL